MVELYFVLLFVVVLSILFAVRESNQNTARVANLLTEIRDELRKQGNTPAR